MLRAALAALLALSLSGAPALARPAPAAGHRCTCGMRSGVRRCTCPGCRPARPTGVPCLRGCGGADDSARPEPHGDPVVLPEAIAALLPSAARRAADTQELPGTHRDCPEPPPPRP